METELTTLAEAGATVLVRLMVTDFWSQAKNRFMRIIAGGKADDRILGLLEESRAELIAAHAKLDEPKETAIKAAWRARLHEVLQSNPTACAELRSLLGMPTTRTGDYTCNINSGNAYYGSIIQSGQIRGNVSSLG